MCGIFGFVSTDHETLGAPFLKRALNSLYLLSESRGKEAAGIAVRSPRGISVYKQAIPASQFVKEARYGAILDDALRAPKGGAVTAPGFAAIGHSRLVTNGEQGVNENNQPVVLEDVVGIHNGIIVNDRQLWERHPSLTRRSDVDSEVIFRLLDFNRKRTGDLESAVSETFGEIAGAASIAGFFSDLDVLLLATNNGSLYWTHDPERKWFVFCSERLILTRFTEQRFVRSMGAALTLNHLLPGQALAVSLESAVPRTFLIGPVRAGKTSPVPTVHVPLKVKDLSGEEAEARRALRRCTRCILPETFPFIDFDAKGVCHFCRNYRKLEPKGVSALNDLLAPHRSGNERQDCIVAVSGGRDSTYGLHFLKTEMGMNPIAYTFDWGIVTDLARRNISRICGKLGVEHVLVSADIRRKRDNIRKNILAWLKRPSLGTVPLFMAGDKEYFHHALRLRKQLGLDLIFFCSNAYEKTNFKTGFCGIRETPSEGGPALRLDSIGLSGKIRMAWFYGKEFLMNPAYLNSSIGDTFKAFLYSYFTPHDFTHFYDYVRWDEGAIQDVLIREYDWETAKDTDTTWRIGDGTAAFYNYIYYTIAGFSEIDTFRSNQIREGILTREKALELVALENQPRYASIREYARVVGFDAERALQIISSMPKLYLPHGGGRSPKFGRVPELARLPAGP